MFDYNVLKGLTDNIIEINENDPKSVIDRNQALSSVVDLLTALIDYEDDPKLRQARELVLQVARRDDQSNTTD